MPRCEVLPGVRIYYEDFGEGDSIVFVCGGQVTHRIWESQVASLAGEYRTITFDWRGTGGSDKLGSGYTSEVVVSDALALLDRLGIDQAVLVGHGLGAHIALLAAERRPGQVSGLFLAAAAPWLSGERDGVAGGLPEDFLRFVTSQQADSRVPYAQICYQLGDDWLFHRRQNPGVYQWILQQSLEWPQYVTNLYAATMRQIDHRTRLPLIRCPVVVAQGRHDRKQRYEGAVYLAQMMPSARLITFEESAHMTFIEELDAFNRALREFAQSATRARRAA